MFRKSIVLSIITLVSLSLVTLVTMGSVFAGDAGNKIQEKKSFTRIISLAPHLTELVYEAGAGSRLIAVTEYSDYPNEAKKLPRVGSSSAIDLERIVSLKPDLVLAWKSGTPIAHRERLTRLGIPLFVFEFQKLEDIAKGIERIGELAGTQEQSVLAAKNFLKKLKVLRARYEKRRPVSVFYQLWNQPMMTVNRNHVTNSVIELCGGKNIYAELNQLVPTVDLESVIKRSPEIIVASGQQRPQWLNDWRRWPAISAVKNNRLYYIESDLIARQSSRVLQGTKRLCQYIEQARN